MKFVSIEEHTKEDIFACDCQDMSVEDILNSSVNVSHDNVDIDFFVHKMCESEKSLYEMLGIDLLL